MPIGTSDGDTYQSEWEYANANEMPRNDTEMATGELNSSEGTDLSKLQEKLLETWPAKAVEGFIDALKLPHDVYYGNIDPTSDEGIKRAANFAMLFGARGLEMEGLDSGIIPVVKKQTKDLASSPYDFDRDAEFTAALRAGLGL